MSYRFRSSFRDWAGNETHFLRELAEHALAHVIGDKGRTSVPSIGRAGATS